jgi:GDP-4-dehydro-6-deoxy-D-mannose reductase
MIKVLITGSRGFVGKHLISHLLKSQSNKGKYEIYEFDLTLGNDIRSYEHIRNSVDSIQPDLIFHLAAQAYVPESSLDPRRGLETNIVGSLNLLEAVKNTGMHSAILMTGTSEEYGYSRDDETLHEDSTCKPTTPYGVSKLAASNLGLVYAKTYGFKVIITRAWNHIGPGASPSYAISAFAKRVAEAEKYKTPVSHGNLDAIRNYTDVRDIVNAYTLLMSPPTPSGIYNLCSANTLSIKEVLDRLINLSDFEIQLIENKNLFRPSDLRFPIPNCDKVNKATGWKVKYPIETTLKDTLDYWRHLV